jgi:predicted RNA binding protein YcfA (HicA-like mRNA interferase family)
LVLKHPDKPGARVVVAMHAREIILVKTLASILEQAGLTADELRELR